jgi:hypothetical protein
MAPVDPLWREGMISALLALHDAAWLIPGVRHTLTDATPEQADHLRRPGVELYQALFEPRRRVRWDCPVAAGRAPRPRVRPSKLLEVHNKRLAVAQVARPASKPSGWRPDQWLVVDLRLVAHEGRPGFHLLCPYCRRIHLFDTRRLAKDKDNTLPVTGPEEPSEPPSVYPSVDLAAFARIDGPYDQLDSELSKDPPGIYLSTTNHRLTLLRRHVQDHPGSLVVYEALLAGPFMRAPDGAGSHRLQHGMYPQDPTRRVWEWPPPPGSDIST